MEDFLKELISKFGKGEKLGSRKDELHIWYNEDGDCVQFQSDQVAIIRQRIDEYLTVYRSAESNEIIGFQLKDIKALINKYECDIFAVKAAVKNKVLISITTLLLKAFSKQSPTINRLQGYDNAIKSVPKENEEVAIPV